jgi:small nuclear ribonucleoprotein (snRNP)-like protein
MKVLGTDGTYKLGLKLIGWTVKVKLINGEIIRGLVKYDYPNYLILVVNQDEIDDMPEDKEVRVYIPPDKILYIVETNPKVKHELQD